ncbi:Spy/CpxP family protein refolding chaperone [Hymenobacter rigui]|uniref:DUF4890 domain-containing protein n=1 Tax=Hymenobacter rigui TaxID=334424 RepID=A0A3R9MPR0_9BACT|nr:hypothetical protein [Hymenobacter rigui]RSK47129.1 hypothetical protein EI291_16150 [Hymenobacter rigui]
MKKLLTASLLLGVLAGAVAPMAQAQTTPVKVKARKDKVKAKPDADVRGGRGPGNRMAEMTKDLNLTANQQTQVAAIQQEQLQQMQALRGNGGTEDREARMQQMRTLDESTDAKLKGVLTPEQFQQYQAAKQNRRQRMGPPPGGNR